ncbi:MAG: O-acetylhomoserine aminocarboxypropyltransferase/cysteine synthase [Eubacterium sp.]|nr:O-acetylhomoserine aminocarboxypropyltransferase/cysteine synthase [Eubacterium sp.]
MAGFDTLKLHAGYSAADHNYAVSVPIYATTAFELGTVQRSDDMFSFDSWDALYSRLSNPTTDVLEARIVELHHATAAVSLASGMAAVTYALLNVTAGSGRILATPRLYGGSIDSFTQVFRENNVGYDIVDDPDDIESYERAVREDTKVIYVESLTNPNATVLDLEAIAEVAHRHNIPLIVDNTLATPYLLNPFDYGADVVVYSATKGLSGHGNVIAGLIVENNQFDWKNGKFNQFLDQPYFLRAQDGSPRSYLDVFPDGPFTGRIRGIHLNYLGAALAPFSGYLVLLGLETLSERIEKAIANTRKIISYLESRLGQEVLWVKHPYAAGNPYRQLAEKYFPKGAGSILSFGLAGTKEQRIRFLEAVRVFGFQANIGDAKSLIINPSTTTHTELEPALQKAADISEETIRLSIGLEDPADLIEDLQQAFAQAFAV